MTRDRLAWLIRETAGVLFVTFALALPLLVFLYGAIVLGVLPLVLIGLLIVGGQLHHDHRNRRRA